MNKSLLEILEEEKRALRNVENFKYSKDGILEKNNKPERVRHCNAAE